MSLEIITTAKEVILNLLGGSATLGVILFFFIIFIILAILQLDKVLILLLPMPAIFAVIKAGIFPLWIKGLILITGGILWAWLVLSLYNKGG